MEVRAEISGVYAGLGNLVVMYILCPAVTSISLSPNFTCDTKHFKICNTKMILDINNNLYNYYW